MASQNRVNGPDSLPANGTEQQRTDLFQNLEKLIASAVSICRLDGSVQCQIGGLITVIEELQRLLRHSFAEIGRLERNLDDQEHTFTNNITNLHYQVNEVQATVEALECDFEEAQRLRETSSAVEQSTQSETELDSSQISLMEESYGYGEESDGGSIPKNVENTAKDDGFTALSEKDEGRITMPASEMTINDNVTSETDTAKNGEAGVKDVEKDDDNSHDNSHGTLPSLDKEAGVKENKITADNGEEALPGLNKDDGEKESGRSAGNSQVSSLSPNKEKSVEENEIGPGNDSNVNGSTNDLEQSHKIPSSTPPLPQDTLKNNDISTSPPKETGTSTSEERENALRVLRSNANNTPNSDSPEQIASNKKNQRYFSNRLEAIETRSSSSTSKDRHSTSPFVIRKSPKIQSSKTFQTVSSPKTSPSKQVFNRSPAKTPQRNQPRGRDSPKQNTSKITKKNMGSSKKALISKIERKSPVGVKLSRKSPDSGGKKTAKIVAKSPAKTKNSPLKQRSVVGKRSASPTNVKTDKDLKRASESVSRETKSNFTGGQKDPKKVSSEPLKENQMDKYIDLDFLLNANQLMSELVTDSNREEGTLDTASEAERRHIVDLAKLYRLRLRMASKEGDLPVALIKGRESSLPKPGQVDRLLHKMTRAMVIKTQLAKSKESAKKHKLAGNKRSMASPAKKKRV